jgi:hypothetical protein
MNRRQAGRERMAARHRIGTYFGYFGFFMGLMSLVTTHSEGTPLRADESGWVVFGWMLGAYMVGFAVAPIVDRLAGTGSSQ